LENAKKFWYYEKWVGRHASFLPRRSVKKKEVLAENLLQTALACLHANRVSWLISH
jgi:hypothetical protein